MQQFPQQQFPPQMPPQYIVEPYNQENENLTKPNKYKSAKGFLICLLALPILFFIACTILFIIMVSNQHSSTISVSHAISTTEQFAKDLLAEPWAVIKTSKDACATTTPKTWKYAEFQGVDSGKIKKVVAGKEYEEVDPESDCTGDCKVQKVMAAKDLEFGYVEGPKKFHLCYQTTAIDKFVMKKPDSPCPTGYRTQCSANVKQFCKKDGPTGVCPIVHLAKDEVTGVAARTLHEDKTFIEKNKGLKSVGEPEDKDKQIVIGVVGGFNRPCKNPEYRGTLYKGLNYPLLGVEYTGCDEHGEYDKKQVPLIYNALTYKTYLDNNGIKNTIEGYQSDYFYDLIGNAELNGKYNLYAKHRPNVRFDAVCQPQEMEELGLIRKYLNSTNRALFVYTIVGLILSCLGLLFWFIMIGSTFTATSKKSKKSNSQILKVMHILGIVLAILLIIFYIHYFSVVDEDFGKIQKINNIFDKSENANCYNEAGDWKNAVDTVHNFISTSLHISKPFIITFFIIGIVYLVLILLVMAATKVKGVSPCFPPYLNYLH